MKGGAWKLDKFSVTLRESIEFISLFFQKSDR